MAIYTYKNLTMGTGALGDRAKEIGNTARRDPGPKVGKVRNRGENRGGARQESGPVPRLA